jgi:hypothetical protein
MAKPKYLKRITKPSQLKAGVRYMRMYVNEHGVGNDIVTPCGQEFNYQGRTMKGYRLFDTVETRQDRIRYPDSARAGQHQGEYSITWLYHNYTVKWSHKAEAFFEELKADYTKRKAWTFFTGKFSDKDWQREQDKWCPYTEYSYTGGDGNETN